MKYLYLIIAAVVLVAPLKADDTNAGVVEIVATYQQYSVFEPWKKLPHRQRSGYGAVISSNLVVTTEAIVRNSTLVELRRSRSGEKFQAVVEAAAPEVNIAILRVIDPAALEGLTRYAITDDLNTGKEVNIVQFDTTREVQSGDGIVIQTKLSSLPNGGGSSLEFTVQTDLNLNGNGSLILMDDKLAGLVMRYSSNDRTAEVLPGKHIKDYAAQVKSGTFKGFAMAGFRWKLPVDPVKRRYLKLPDDQHGIMLTEISPDSSKLNDLQTEDVIVSWNGFDIDPLGYYNDPDYGRLLWSYLIKGHGKPGEKAELVLYRKGKRKNVTITLLNTEDSDELIPSNLTNERSEYLIEGGIVLRELNAEYLRAYGSEWTSRMTPRLAYLYLNQPIGNEEKGKRVVIISRILQNKINEGYNSFYHHIVSHVNGKEILNMDDVFNIHKKDGAITSITLKYVGSDIIFDKDILEEANSEISSSYRIPEMHFRHGDDADE